MTVYDAYDLLNDQPCSSGFKCYMTFYYLNFKGVRLSMVLGFLKFGMSKLYQYSNYSIYVINVHRFIIPIPSAQAEMVYNAVNS